ASAANQPEAGAPDAPWSGPLLTNLATCHAARGEFAAAWPLYERAWELSGRSPLVLLERAEARHRSGASDRAAADLQAAVYSVLSESHLPIPSIGIPLAWTLLTFPDPALRDAPSARRILVALSMREDWASDATLQTLLAYAEVLCGEPQQAVERLALHAQPDAPCPFHAAVRAAAARALGLPDEAAVWLRQAEDGARCLPYPDPRLERLLEQVRETSAGGRQPQSTTGIATARQARSP
ncbi:MAG: hypothetical protein AB1716_24530, partial [Planctomycetota bacterium]